MLEHALSYLTAVGPALPNLAASTASALPNLAAPAGSDPLNISGLQAMEGGVFVLVVGFVAIRAALHALRSGWAAALTAACIVAIGAAIYGLATTGEFAQLGINVLHTVLK